MSQEMIFRSAASFQERHGLFVALVGDTNVGKTFSAMRLARGVAGPKGKVAVIDTEGGRTLHLRNHFDFDFLMLEPPHRPERYMAVAKKAQDDGYAALLIDSFSNEWRGIGGVLDWEDQELEQYVERQRAFAATKGWVFDESRTRNAGKAAARIRPKMAHKLMVSGLLGLRIPIIFAIRGGMIFDPETKKETFKSQCQPGFLFEVTVSFRLANEHKGIIDLSDAGAWKMEGAHAPIFKDGELLSERHGELLNAWATNAPLPPKEAGVDAAAEGWKKPTSLKVALAAIAQLTPTQAAKWNADAKDWLTEIHGKNPDAAAQVVAALHERMPKEPIFDDDAGRCDGAIPEIA